MQCHLNITILFKKNPVQPCLRGSRRHGAAKNLSNVVFILLKHYCTCNVVIETPENIALEKILVNVVRDAPDNIAPEKILFNVVLTLLEQHCTGKNFIQ